MYSRTYDAQRFSPLKQITRQNVGQLEEVFKKELGAMGNVESIPIVYRGVMYVRAAGRGRARARRDHRRADLGAQARRQRPAPRRSRSTTTWSSTPRPTACSWRSMRGPARCAGRPRPPAAPRRAPIVVEGKVLTGRTCSPRRENCYVAAHDAKTGKEVWQFYTAAGDDDPGGETWGGAPEATRVGLDVGPARRLRSGPPPGLLGRREPDAEHARRPARRQRRRDPDVRRRRISTAIRRSR